MTHFNNYLHDDFPISIVINVGAEFTFKNFKEIEGHFDKEIQFYEDIKLLYNRNVINFASTAKKGVRDLINKTRQEGFVFEDLVIEIKNYIESKYKNSGIVSFNSREGIWLLQNKDLPTNRLFGAFEYFQNKVKKREGNSDMNSRLGEVSAYLFDKGISTSFKSEKDKYETFYKNYIEKRDQLKLDVENIRKLNEEFKKNFDDQKDFYIQEFNRQVEIHKVKMSESEDFYEKKLAVKNAVTYWKEKANKHLRNSWVFGGISFLLMFIALYFLYSFGNYILDIDMNAVDSKGKRLLDEKGALQLWVYGFFLVGVTLSIWFIRLIVKVFLSNLHLLSDAKERETMILTYLAFEREENTLEPGDRNLILPAIFRVSTNGYIKDDSTPNSPINIIAKKFTD